MYQIRVPLTRGKLILLLIVLGIILIPLLTWVYVNLNKPSTKTPTQLQSTPAPKLTLSCPVPKDFCQKGKAVTDGNQFYGISFKLPVGTSLTASFTGYLSDKPPIPNRSSSQPYLYLLNKGYEVIYSFYGTPAKVGSFYEEGKEVGKIGTGGFPSEVPFAGDNFLLSVKKDNKYIKINPEDLK